MLLSSLEVRNYRSLEHVKIEGLSEINVFIGQNNAGKSTVLGALQYLAAKAFRLERSNNLPNDPSVLTAHESSRNLEYHLEFQLLGDERARLIEDLVQLGFRRERQEALLASPFLRQVAYEFASPPSLPHMLDLRELRVRSGDGRWARFLVGGDTPNSVTGQYVISDARSLDTLSRSESMLYDEIDVLEGARLRTSVHGSPGNSTHIWMMSELAQYFTTAYFFSPFRHSTEGLYADVRTTLAPDGSDLAVVLNFLSGKDRERFRRIIEEFLHEAVPEVGMMHAGLVGSVHQGTPSSQSVEITFRSTDGYDLGLREMGGGVEQLLMVAACLATVEGDATLFLEEPEMHLHPGAQRYLIERLRAESRQVFITTHSPVFVNQMTPRSVYRVEMRTSRTTVTRVKDAAGLAELMDDIGARNSDVLLSDAVLFVEGPTDREIVENWSRVLGRNLGEHNVSVIAMGGGRNAEHQAPARSQVLEGISRRAPVPHLFLLDKDERGHAEVEHLKSQLGQRLHLLSRREIENYLLVPRAILAAIATKYGDNATVVQQVEDANLEDIDRLIQQAAADLYGQTLLKRIKVKVGGLRDGLLPSESIGVLASKASEPSFSTLVKDVIKDRVDSVVSNLDLDSLIQSEREVLDTEWDDPERRLSLAPGAEILKQVFRRFGGEFDKRRDSPRIASKMQANEIDPEITELIKRLAELPSVVSHKA